MQFDMRKLRGRITEKYGTQRKFAAAIGWTESKMSQRLNGVSEFSREDILLLSQALGLPGTEISEYFFVPKKF
jgi:transcriptional regulator with XRE-family HTH domain